MKHKASDLQSMQGNLAKILGTQRLQELSGLTRLRRLWPDIVGKMMASRTEPLQLKPGEGGSYILVIAVTHSTMAQEIVFLRDHIRQACFDHARMGRISKIYTEVRIDAGFHEKDVPITLTKITLSKKKELARELQIIKNIALRRAMFKARLAQLRYHQKEFQ
ncbi:MAG: DciA family protein [Mariprofundaceae bacterium]|nr:DciA family protein [Mariprofundaceae bacterium]